MMVRRTILGVSLLLFGSGCGEAKESARKPAPEPAHVQVSDAHDVSLDEGQWALVRSMAKVPELPVDPTNRVADNLDAAALGHQLFFDERLSGNKSISCATCHDPSLDFTDSKRVAVGIGTTTRNAPTVLNAAFHRWLTWDGRADSLWAQALEPLENDIEMGGNRVAIVRTVANDPLLRAQYETLFGPLPDLSDLPSNARPRRDGASDERSQAWEAIDPAKREAITAAFVNIGKSIGAYQRRLISLDAPFDHFVESAESGAYEPVDGFSERAVRGLHLFVGEAGCWECHAGPMLTTGAFHDIGVPPVAGGMPTDAGRFSGADVVMADPFNAAGEYSDANDGVEARLVRSLINSPDNWGRFRTPSLREVSRTAPYMHEGRFQTLEEVVAYYSSLEGAVQLDHHQENVLLPLNLTEQEQADLVAFLQTLDGTPLEARWGGEPPKGASGP